jgi:hypothetical protein
VAEAAQEPTERISWWRRVFGGRGLDEGARNLLYIIVGALAVAAFGWVWKTQVIQWATAIVGYLHFVEFALAILYAVGYVVLHGLGIVGS